MRDLMQGLSAFLTKIPNWVFVLPIFFIMLPPYLSVFKDNNAENNDSFHITPGESEVRTFEIIENLPAGSKVLILVNYGPESRYELEPAMSALIGILAGKNIGIAFATMIPNGIESTFLSVEKAIENGSFGSERFVYGHEYTHLGFIVGGNIATYLITNNFAEVRERDIFNSNMNIHQPLMNGISGISDFSAVFEFSSQTFDGVPGLVSFAVMLKNKEIKKVAFCSSDMLSAYIPFRDSVYLDGLIGGFKSIAVFIHEYQPAFKTERLYSIFSMTLFYIIGLVILANLIKLATKSRK